MSGLPIIAIDPGHNCVPDIGASYLQYSEDKIVLAVAEALTKICQSKGIKTIDCLPKSATSVKNSLDQRVNKSNENGATIYASIHCNVANPTTGARGCETFAISTAGKAIAANINRELGKLGFANRGVKETLDAGVPPYVIRTTNAIAVLVEICFLDATLDMKVLNNNGITAIAQAIFDGLTHGTKFDTNSDNEANDPVEPKVESFLASAAKYYRGLPHQDIAWKQLESLLTGSQLTDFKEAFSPPQAPIIATIPVKVPLTVAEPVKSRSNWSVAAWIDNGDGTTSGVDGLSNQIIQEMGSVGLARFTHSRFKPGINCDPFFCFEVAKKLDYILNASGLVMECNSAYRSPVRQLVLRTFFDRQMHGFTAVNQVGQSNHERGIAIDLKNWETWKPILIKAGWKWQGANDPMHFEWNYDSKVPQEAIKAYQRLATKNGHKLIEDGVWGNATKISMLSAPAAGW